MEPKIRLKGFSGEWTETTLADVGKCFSGIGFPETEQGGKMGIPFYKVSDMNNIGNEKIMSNSNNYVTDEQVKKNGWKVCNDVPAIYFAKVGAAVLLNRKRLALKPCLCDNNTMLYSFNKNVWDTFFCQSYFETIDLASLVQVGSLPSFNGSMVGGIKVFIPQYDEQQALGAFFQHLDSLIQSTIRKIESLKQIKAASLQSMFPQEGETTPRVRFKGFEGEWEMVTIKDVATFLKGRGYSKSDLRVTGTPIILYGRMYTKYETCITNVDTYVNPLPSSIYTSGNEVVMPASGETPEDISCASAIKARGIILGGDLNILRFDTDYYDTTFVALSLSNGKAKKDLSNMAQGKSVVHLHNSDIEKVDIFIPSFSEQCAIASYFTTLDRKITLQTQRLDKLKQIKSACLDNMFV